MSRRSTIVALLGSGLVLWAGCSGAPETAADAGPDSEPASKAPPVAVPDPLSMPAEPTLDPSRFQSAKECARCHPTQYAEWSTSSHAYAMVDPVYRVLVRQRQIDLDTEEDQFCTQCHSPIGTRGGECVPGFDFDDLSPVVLEGVNCETCHRMASLERDHNAGFVLDPDIGVGARLADPMQTSAHETRRADEIYGSSAMCGACHDVVETGGLNLERPYAEWRESPLAGSEKTCQSCHMPTRDGTAAVGGPERTGLHVHTFTGVSEPLLDEFAPGEATRAKMRAATDALFEGVASVELRAAEKVAPGQQLDLFVSVTNNIEGHNLPTGTTFIRQLWLSVEARDASGRVIYETGHLDQNGDLRGYFSAEPYSDPDLIALNSQLIGHNGTPELFPWRATEHRLSSLPPLYTRTFTLFVPVPEDAEGPVSVEARLRFRPYPPFLLRALGLDDLVEKVSIRDLAEASIEVAVAAQ